jgi:hypothetical protein
MAYWTFTITMRDQAITYPSPACPEVPHGQTMRGFSKHDFDTIVLNAARLHIPVSRYNLNELIPQYESEYAELLVLSPEAVDILTDGNSNLMLSDLMASTFNEEAYMYGQLRKRHAQQSAVFSNFEQEGDMKNGKPIVHDFKSISYLSQLRRGISELVERPELADCVAETNRYKNTASDQNMCGVGFHGDRESNLVCAVRLGSELPLSYQWYHRSQPIGKRFEVLLEGGSIYFMSEKAVGKDYKSSSKFTLRHAAGGPKYAPLNDFILKKRHSAEVYRFFLRDGLERGKEKKS